MPNPFRKGRAPVPGLICLEVESYGDRIRSDNICSLRRSGGRRAERAVVRKRAAMEERAIAEGCRRGDAAARRALYDRYAGRLLALMLRYGGDRPTAEDLMHDVFLRLFDRIDRFTWRGEGSLRAWIERVAVNHAIEWLRRRNRLGTVPLEEHRALPSEEEPTAEEAVSVPREELLRMVAALPDGYRAVFNLYCIEGHSHAEIARMLGIQEKTSSSQLLRARRLLARQVRDYLKTHDL